MKTLLFGHRVKQEDVPYIKELTQILETEGYKVILHNRLADQLKNEFKLRSFNDYPVIKELDKSDLPDCCITLGGDGTILRAIMTIKDCGVPILGINLGRLGFLASTEKTRIKEAISQLKNKQYKIKTSCLILIGQMELYWRPRRVPQDIL